MMYRENEPTMLEKIERYGNQIYSSPAENSKYCGKEFDGQLWNPWLFRRWLPSQLERKLSEWKNLPEACGISASEYVVGTVAKLSIDQSESISSFVDSVSEDKLGKNVSKFYKLFPLFDAKTGGIQCIPLFKSVGDLLLERLCQATRLTSQEFWYAMGSITEFGGLTATQELLLERLGLRSGDPRTFYVVKDLIVSRDSCGLPLDKLWVEEGFVKCLSNDPFKLAILREFETLQFLEVQGGEAFEERSKIFPPSVFGVLRYGEVRAEGVRNSVDFLAYERAYVKAGVYYWHKSKVWSGEESLKSCRAILEWDDVQVEEELKKIAELL